MIRQLYWGTLGDGRQGPQGPMVVERERVNARATERRRSRLVVARASSAMAALLVLTTVSLLASLQTASPSTAASQLDAATIDAFLAAQGSPMTGAGATFVAEGAEHGVDPAFLVAVAGAESSFGLYLYSSGGDYATFNAFNWFYTATRQDADFGSWDEAIAAVAAGIAGDLYYGSDLYAVDAIGPRYCPEGTVDWLSNVTLFMAQLGGDPLDVRWTGAAPPPAATGVLELAGHVELSAAPYVVGDTVTARFALRNAGGAALEVADVRLAVRDPADAARDLVSLGSLTLAPGEERAFSGTWSLGSAGRWSGWVELRYEGRRVLLGSTRAFALRAGLPRDLRVRRWTLAELQLTQRP